MIESSLIRSFVLTQYTFISYWEERFAIEDSYEWLAAFDTLRPALTRLLPPAHSCPKLLLVG
jgi:hypothetical protein